MSEFHGDTEDFKHDHIQDESDNDDENETLESNVSDSEVEPEKYEITTREGTLRIIITKESMAKQECSLFERIIYYIFFPSYFMRDLNKVMRG